MMINRNKTFLAAFACIAAGSIPQVQAINWVGGVGGTWETPGNWGGAVPVGGDFIGFSGTESAVIGSGVNAVTWRGNLQGGNVGGGGLASVTINTGGSLTTGVLPNGGSVAGLNLNWGGSGGNSASAINVTGGTFVSQLVRVGGSGAGQEATLNVTAGGSATLTTLDFDQTGGAARTVLVDGAGSSLNVTGTLDIDGGFATATVSNGGSVTVGGTLSLGSSIFNLDGGSLAVDTMTSIGSAFNWGDGTLTTASNIASGSTDFSDAAIGPVIRGGTTLAVTGDLSTGVGDSSGLSLGGLFINSGVRANIMTVSGDLDLSATGDSLSAIQGAYLLRPNTGLAVDFGEIPLITVTGNLTGTFDTFIAPGTDNIGFTEYTGAWTVGSSGAADLPKNTWFLEYDETADTVSFFYKVEGTVPEPGTVGLLTMGLLFIRLIRRFQDPQWA